MVGPQGVTKVGRAQGSQRGVAIATVGALHPVSQGASREVGTASQDPSLQHMDGAKQQQRSGRKGPWSHPVPAWLLPALRQLHPQGVREHRAGYVVQRVSLTGGYRAGRVRVGQRASANG